ncbi:MAG: lipopolysaccharide biosynthesis protein [Candidatus Accumulibacter phosphatis]|jgi:teichuronic acid exporter|uniref:lipopolysaccharide biosynthesis protein n=1 Tax=Candidatus Accumulibacter sp. ACC012 TaxID=2823332 RepID=UPI0025BF89BD|nr:lipopolysaccharide biosynthesis protein [Candidatus Accumulibacter sp. ACC012]
MNLKSQVVVGLSWVAGANFLGQLVTWGITIFVMRILNPTDYGLLAMASVFVAFLGLMATAGLGPAIVQASKVDDTMLRQILGLIILVNLTLFCLLFFAAPLIAGFFDETRLTDIIRVLSLQFVISSFSLVPDSLLGRELKFKIRALIDLSTHVAGGTLTLALALSGYGVWSLVAGAIFSAMLKAIGVNFAVPSLGWPSFSFHGIGRLISFGGKVTLGRVLWFFYIQADMFIAGKLLGKEALGFYSVAMHLASLPVQKISGILNQVAFPAFSKIQNDPEMIKSHVLKAVRILSFFSFPVLLGISSVAPELVHLLLGSKWEPAIFPLQILPAIMPIRMINSFLPSAVDAVGRPDISMKNLIGASIIMPLAFIIGAQWDVEGLCFAWLIGFPLVFLSNLWRALPAINITILELLKAISWPALASIMMYGGVALVRFWLPPEISSVWRMISMILVGAIVYGALAASTNRHGCQEVIGTLRR